MSKKTFLDSLQLLGSRRFGTFWFASLLSNIGTWAQQVAQPWLLLSLGASPFVLGLDSFALSAPVFLLTLVGGALADSADRRRTIVLFQSIQMLCPVLLVVLLILGRVEPWTVIVLSLVVGITDGLSMPSFQSIVPTMVPKPQIPIGLALNATQFNLSRILGPAVAGVVMGAVGATGAFAVSALSYVPFILVALWVLPKQRPDAGERKGFAWRAMVANVQTVWQQTQQRGALLTVFVSGLLCTPLVIFCPVLVRDTLQGDVSHFSQAIAAFGVGGLLGAIGLLGVDPNKDRRPFSSAMALTFGLAVAVAACNTSRWGLPLLYALAGVAMTVSNSSANALLQSQSLPITRGQTVSLFMLSMRGGMAIGGLLTGLTVSLLGVREALLINGVLAMVLQSGIALWWAKQPSLALD